MSAVNWILKIKGFGPFDQQLNWTMEACSSKIAIYAGNGQGKTAISRLFRLVENNQTAIPSDLVTRGISKGSFSFSVSDNITSLGTVDIDSNTGVNNRLDYLFHVFNSDYVRENLQTKSYSLSGDIEGFIVGKANIDLTAERQHLESIQQEGTCAKEKLTALIKERKAELVELGANTVQEYKQLTTDVLLNDPVETDYYNEKTKQLEAINKLPENAQAPKPLHFDVSYLDLDGFATLIEQSYSKAQFAESFLDKVRKNTEFIKAGMHIQDGVTCPFCGRKYNEEAHFLITEYDDYLKDQESKVIDALNNADFNFERLISDYRRFEGQALQASTIFNDLKTGFDNLAKTKFPPFATAKELNNIIEDIRNVIKNKIEDITLSFSREILDGLQSNLNTIQAGISNANNLLKSLDTSLEKSTAQRTRLRKAVCVELGKKIRRDYNNTFERVNKLRTDYKQLNEEIRVKEAQNKQSKRDIVAQLMGNLLESTFGEKYVFDPNAFVIRFHGEALRESAETILSDGEKSVLAFCFYIASTWELLDNESDKSRLFFIIDDPISSMDYHHVYSIAQIIRDLPRLFSFNTLRSIILTHNAAFFNMLIGNKIMQEPYVLANKTIKRCGGRTITPYFEHLLDIQKVADGDPPTHTTGNSIRQILESLWHFEEPAIQNLNDYLHCERCKDLLKVPYIYSLCQDESHGTLVFEMSSNADESSIRRACSAVINHIRTTYEGHLKVAGIV